MERLAGDGPFVQRKEGRKEADLRDRLTQFAYIRQYSTEMQNSIALQYSTGI